MQTLSEFFSYSNFESLAGKFLISSPYAFEKNVFNKSLIYLVSHTEDGALGLIINHMVQTLPADVILKLFKEDDVNTKNVSFPIYLGGPVDPERGFVLHTSEYDKNLLVKTDMNLAVSSNIQILRDIALGVGPVRSLVILGYTGWQKGQLEEELEKNMWIVSNSYNDIIFSTDVQDKWSAALGRVGISDSNYMPYVGHC